MWICAVLQISWIIIKKTKLLADRYSLKMNADNNDYFTNTCNSMASALFKQFYCRNQWKLRKYALKVKILGLLSGRNISFAG